MPKLTTGILIWEDRLPRVARILIGSHLSVAHPKCVVHTTQPARPARYPWYVGHTTRSYWWKNAIRKCAVHTTRSDPPDVNRNRKQWGVITTARSDPLQHTGVDCQPPHHLEHLQKSWSPVWHVAEAEYVVHTNLCGPYPWPFACHASSGLANRVMNGTVRYTWSVNPNWNIGIFPSHFLHLLSSQLVG